MSFSVSSGQELKNEYDQYEELPSSPQHNKHNTSVAVSPIYISISSSDDDDDVVINSSEDEVSPPPPPQQQQPLPASPPALRPNNNNNNNNSKKHTSREVFQNFIIMSILLSANHGSMVSCLAFATLELGSVGAYQSAILHLVFAMSSLMGACYIVKYIGAKTSLIIGMAFYTLYVGSFWIALQYPSVLEPFAILGAIVGGLGGGLIWTAQGTYFGYASCDYAISLQSLSNVDNHDDNDDDGITTTEVYDDDNNSSSINSCYSNGHHDETTQIRPRSRGQRLSRQRFQRQGNYNTNATALFGGIFAFVYLALEVGAKVLSYLILRRDGAETATAAANNSSWSIVFGVYTIIALISTFGMIFIKDYPTSSPCSPPSPPLPGQEQEEQHSPYHNHHIGGDVRQTPSPSSPFLYQLTSAWHLLREDAKMKYMIGLSAVFGFASPFVNSYVNGEVLYKLLLHDNHEMSSMTSSATTIIIDDTTGGSSSSSSSHLEYAGLFSAVTSIVAALCSLLFGHVAQYVGKGPILHFGSLCFAMVVLPFLFSETSTDTTMKWTTIIFIYVFQGIGRSTFEGTLKATFADFFPNEKESAFGNLVLQSGIFTSLGYYLSYGLQCSNTSTSTSSAEFGASLVDHHHSSSSLPSLSPTHPHQNYCIRTPHGLKCSSAIPIHNDGESQQLLRTSSSSSTLQSSNFDSCVQFKDGTLHNIAPLQWLIIVSCILAMLGYWRASVLFQKEQEQEQQEQHQEDEEDQNEMSINNISMMDTITTNNNKEEASLTTSTKAKNKSSSSSQ